MKSRTAQLIFQSVYAALALVACVGSVGFYDMKFTSDFYIYSDKLVKAGCRYSKGAIRIPYSDELPLTLISEIAAWCRDTGNHA